MADLTQSPMTGTTGTTGASSTGASSTTGNASTTGGLSASAGTSGPTAGGSTGSTAAQTTVESPAGTSGDVGELQPGQSPNRPSSTYAQNQSSRSVPTQSSSSQAQASPSQTVPIAGQSPQSAIPEAGGPSVPQALPGTSATSSTTGALATTGGVSEDVPPASVRVSTIARGAKLVFRAESRAQVANLRRILRQHADLLRQGVCPIIRFRQTPMTTMIERSPSQPLASL